MLSALLMFAALAAVQDPTPAPPLPAPPAPKPAQPAAPRKNPDDALPALVPGQLPADASEAARAAWSAMCAATSGDKPQPKVTGFDLHFDGRVRQAGDQGLHDLSDARYRYSEPGWISTILSKGNERLRGPRGDWFIKDGAPTKLQGLDFQNDTRELDDNVQVARTFVSLIDPRALRLRSLALLPAPPFALPAAMLEDAKKLTWIDVVSPDFERPRAAAPAESQPPQRPVRAQIGLDPKTHLPQLAFVAQDEHGTIVHETALLVKLDKWRALDGFQVPGLLLTYPPDLDPAHSPWTFGEQFNLKLGLREGTLRPKLVEQDFLPPEKH
jgi:hypothetical protein